MKKETHTFLFLKVKAIILLLVFLTPFSFKLVHHHDCVDNLVADHDYEVNIQNTGCDCDLHKFNFSDTFKPEVYQIKYSKKVVNHKVIIDNYNFQLQFLIDYSKSLRGPPSILS